MSNIVLAVHAGAGRFARRKLQKPDRHLYEVGLEDALLAGQRILLRGGSALNAVTEAVAMMEDNQLYNAGRGAALCADGTIELSASVMSGHDLRVGAMAGLKRVRNPVRAARTMMGHSHVLMFGHEAERYAEAKGSVIVPAPYFYTKARRRQWASLRGLKAATLATGDEESSRGTVGAVARDRRGNLAAATSTGGLINQLPGRVGDTPIIGAGTWADNRTCAVSATGEGDAFARICFARRVSDLIELKRASAAQAALIALDEVRKVKGKGGCILVDAKGRLALPFNTPHMLRGWVRGKGTPLIALLPEEERAGI